MSHNNLKSGRNAGRLGLLALTPIMAAIMAGSLPTAEAAPKPFTATAKYDKKAGKVVVVGKTAAGIAANARVTVYDAGSQTILYTANTDAKKAFNFKLLSASSVPCLVRVEVTSPANNTVSKALLTVAGAAKTCASTAAVPACAISAPAADTEIAVGQSVDFKSATFKTKRGVTPTYLWSVSDGSADQTTATFNRPFSAPGRYKVTLKVNAGGNQCTDDVIVSVIPQGANPYGKVPESPAPGVGGAMPQGAQNDADAYVVLPYEELGMQGGSQIHLPYNAMINYNSLNAQVIQKKAHKPPIVPSSSVDVVYSAASNPNDPIAANSINSTSQNLFSGQKIGANYDTAASTTAITSSTANGVVTQNQAITKNVFVSGQDYREATIAKSEQWDRMHQPFAAANSKDETGKAFADDQNRFTPPLPYAKPDQGLRGQIDNAAGMRQMPGIADPYKVNNPQPFAFRADQNAFVAQMIPASDIDDQGRTNPYPLMRVEAKDKAGNVVAKADAVYTTASDTRCRECHAKGEMGSDNTVWRTPVTEDELKDPNDAGKPGPATGAGSYAPGADPMKAWPPAIHNRFDDKIADNANFTNLGVTKDSSKPFSATNIPVDANGLRTDRVEESRWAKFDLTTMKPTGETSPTKPANADASWKLQIRVKYRDASAPDNVTELAGKPAGNTWIDKEKAALFNTLVAHDYMVYYGPTPAANKTWPASYSTQVADSYADDLGKSRAQPMYFCSGHHQSHLKADFGIVAQPTQTNRSDYSRAFHAFHGKFQVYAKDVTSSESKDGLAHKKGDLIRDFRGHPVMVGGRGWDSQRNDNNGVPLTADPNDASGALTKKTVAAYDPIKNDWRPDLYPALYDKEPAIAAPLFQFSDKTPNEENCVKCHTGPTEKSYRDIHHTAGLKCESCHGDMLAVGMAYQAPMYNFNLTGGGSYAGSSINFRRPWMDEPNCGSCHIGDGNIKKTDPLFYSAGALKQAWINNNEHEGLTVNDTATTEKFMKLSELFTSKVGTGAGASTHPVNARFAVMPSLEDRMEFSNQTVNGVTTTVYTPKKLSTVLYRKSADVHGSKAGSPLACAACHGGSHAIWPNQDPNANDNQTAKQLQGYDGNIAECSVCHIKDDFKTGLVANDGGDENLGVAQGLRSGTATVVTPAGVDVNGAASKFGRAYLAGPHGLHPIGDESWYKHAAGAAENTSKGKHNANLNGGWHNDMAGKPGPDGEDQCAACHGKDHKGTRLSKSLSDRTQPGRTLTNAKGKPVKVAKGQIIGCDLCHALDKSFSNSPNPADKLNHGWQPAKEHMPPMPATFSATGSGGGGGGH
ncbi:MAG: PKD domain-containing protein [Methylococcales bacterium]